MEYIILTAATGEDLTIKVRSYITNGWRPYGQYHTVVKEVTSITRRRSIFSPSQTNTHNRLEYSQELRKSF